MVFKLFKNLLNYNSHLPVIKVALFSINLILEIFYISSSCLVVLQLKVTIHSTVEIINFFFFSIFQVSLLQKGHRNFNRMCICWKYDAFNLLICYKQFFELTLSWLNENGKYVRDSWLLLILKFRWYSK